MADQGTVGQLADDYGARLNVGYDHGRVVIGHHYLNAAQRDEFTVLYFLAVKGAEAYEEASDA